MLDQQNYASLGVTPTVMIKSEQAPGMRMNQTQMMTAGTSTGQVNILSPAAGRLTVIDQI